MKKGKKIELIGFVLIIIGTTWKFATRFSGSEFMNKYLSEFQLIFYFGLAVWAFGYLRSKSSNNSNNNE